MFITLIATFTLGCGSTASPPAPHVVPVSQADLDRELKHDQTKETETAAAFHEAATKKFAGKDFSVMIADTDSMSTGPDSWRSCAELKPEMFGIPKDALVVMVDQDGAACTDSFEKYVTSVAIAVPGTELPKLSAPTHKDELMTVMIATSYTVPATGYNPQTQMLSVSVSPGMEDAPLTTLIILGIYQALHKQNPDQPITMTIVALAAEDAGTDGWRSCKNVDHQMFGLRSGTAMAFVSKSEKSCADDPDGVIGYMVIGEVGETHVKTDLIEPEKNGEKIRVIGSESFVQ